MAFNFNVFFTIVGLTEYFIINISSIDSQAGQEKVLALYMKHQKVKNYVQVSGNSSQKMASDVV